MKELIELKLAKQNRMCVSACFMDDTVPHYSSYSRVEVEVQTIKECTREIKKKIFDELNSGNHNNEITELLLLHSTVKKVHVWIDHTL